MKIEKAINETENELYKMFGESMAGQYRRQGMEEFIILFKKKLELTAKTDCNHSEKQWIPNGGNGYYRCKKCKVKLENKSIGEKE